MSEIIRKIGYISAIVLMILGLVMAVFSLVVALIPGGSQPFALSALSVPGVCLLVALIGFVGMKYFKEKR